MAVNPHLTAHFPHMFPAPRTIENIEKERRKYPTRGDDGCEDPDDTTFCDRQYLDSIILKINHIETKVEMWYLKCTRRFMPHHADFDPRTHVREALTELADITKHVRRLCDNRVLFGSSLTRDDFFREVSMCVKHAAQSLQQHMRVNDQLEAISTAASVAIASAPILPGDTDPLPPWTTWCDVPDLSKVGGAEIEAIRNYKPGSKLVKYQLIPAQGLLIQEHWRSKVGGFCDDIAASSADPQRVLRLKPEPAHALNKICEGEGSMAGTTTLTKMTRMPAFTEKRGKVWAFGEQEPVEIGRIARGIAKMLGEETTLGMPAALERVVLSEEDNAAN